MAEKKYYIYLSQGPVEVPYDVYLTYYRLQRREHFQCEKDHYHGVSSYNALDTDNLLGEDMLPNQDGHSVEDLVVNKLLLEWLHHCLNLLPSQERALIQAIYFEGMSDKEYAQALGVSRQAVTKRRHKVLHFLRKRINL